MNLFLKVLESSIQKLGRTLADQSQKQAPGIFDHRRWTNLLLDWGTRDEHFKVQLFRFVDVLPTLRTDAQFIRIIKEYFEDLSSIPPPLRWLLKRISSNPLTAHTSAFLLRRQFLKMAESFMAGHSVEHALSPFSVDCGPKGAHFRSIYWEKPLLAKKKQTVTKINVFTPSGSLGKKTPQWPAAPILERDHLGSIPRIQLSVKISLHCISQLDPIDPEGSYQNVANRLRPILDLSCRTSRFHHSGYGTKLS